MNKLIYILLLITSTILVSCLDIVEEIELYKNNKGKVIYSINLSKSKTKLNALLKLDSIYGYEVPKIEDIERKILKITSEIREKEGILDAKFHINNIEYIYNIEIEFLDIKYLDNAIKSIPIIKENKINTTLYSILDNKFIKKIYIPNFKEEELKEIEKRKESLQEARYVFILRNYENIKKISPNKLNTSKNNKAVMYSENLYKILKSKESIIINIKPNL